MSALSDLAEDKRNELKERFCYDNVEQMEGIQVYNRIMNHVKLNIKTLEKEMPGLIKTIETLEDHRSALIKAHFKAVVVYDLVLTGVDCFFTDDFIDALAALDVADTKIVTLGFFIEADIQRVEVSKKIKPIIDPILTEKWRKTMQKIFVK